MARLVSFTLTLWLLLLGVLALPQASAVYLVSYADLCLEVGNDAQVCMGVCGGYENHEIDPKAQPRTRPVGIIIWVPGPAFVEPGIAGTGVDYGNHKMGYDESC